MAKPPVDMTGKSVKFRDIKEIMNVPSMKAALMSYVDEATNHMLKIQANKDQIKRIREDVVDELGLKPAIFNQYVAMVHNNDYLKRRDKLEEIMDMIDAVMREKDMPLLPPEDKEED